MQILRHAWGQGNIHFPCSADHEQDCQPYPVDPYFPICDDHGGLEKFGFVIKTGWSVIVPFFLLRTLVVCVCVCVFSSHSFWTSSSWDVPAGVTQEEGHTGFLIHLLSAVRALIFLVRRIQPFLSHVDRQVEFCVLRPLLMLLEMLSENGFF